MSLPTFLPGRFTLERGTSADYRQLECFHYVRKRPRTWAGVWVVRYATTERSRVVAVGVLSWPTACSHGRERFFGTAGRPYGQKIRFANATVRTISRVIVHPQFRSLGLATALVRCLCEQCPTRYVEAAAQMARAVPMFERAGMTRVEPVDADRPVYYVLDKGVE